MKRTYLVEDRAFYRSDPEWSSSMIRRFSSISKARAFAKKLPLGGWIDIKEGGKIIATCNVSVKKAKKARTTK